MDHLVRAAGGVVIDPRRKGRFAVIHRPRYDDWTLPKGKLRAGETARIAAVREVYEETGLVCDVTEELRQVEYVTRNGNLKSVSWFLMQRVGGEFAVNDEADALTWLKRSQALALLTYDYEHAVLVDAHRRVRELRRAAKRSGVAVPTARPLPAADRDNLGEPAQG